MVRSSVSAFAALKLSLTFDVALVVLVAAALVGLTSSLVKSSGI